MIAYLDDFGLWVYVLVDDNCQALEGHMGRPASRLVCGESELIPICLVS